MKKVIREGKVAVVISDNYDWSSFCVLNESKEVMMFHPLIVEMVEAGASLTDELKATLLEQVNSKDSKKELDYRLDTPFDNELRIVWLPIGTKFIVLSNEMNEFILKEDDLDFTA